VLMAGQSAQAIMGERKGGSVHIVMLSLMIALAACLLLLAAFGLVTSHIDSRRRFR
jgi:hypothetical protein